MLLSLLDIHSMLCLNTRIEGGMEEKMADNYRIVMEVSDENEPENELKDECFLLKFVQYKKICIQCHDNPDADALASGFALYKFYESKGIDVTFIYSGSNKITKPNLLLMIRALEIPVQYVTELPDCELLFLTDCQYGSGNVTYFEAPEVATIDHHQCGMMQNENYWIKSNLGSCATAVWALMNNLGYPFREDLNLSTALYYGLYMDTNHFEEIFHPLDKDMRDYLQTKEQLLFQLENTNLSMAELEIASKALISKIYNEEYRFAVIPSETCDPNILGIISDFVIQVEEINSCIAFNPNSGGYKISVRSCDKEMKANEMAEYICNGIGNGGGHLTKAGGFIAMKPLQETYKGKKAEEVLVERMVDYHKAYDVIYAKDYRADLSAMERYQKKKIIVGVVMASEFLKEGTPVMVRTLEGDVDLLVENDLYFMVGIEGEVYPIRKEKFDRSYQLVEGEPEMAMEYTPNVRNNIDGEVYQLMDYMKTCVSTGVTKIYAKKLEHNVKVFTAWDEDKYYRGIVGDYLVVREDDLHDVYVVRSDIFDKTYEKIS